MFCILTCLSAQSFAIYGNPFQELARKMALASVVLWVFSPTLTGFDKLEPTLRFTLGSVYHELIHG